MLLAWGVGSDTRWGEADRSMQLSKVLQLSQLSMQVLPRTCRFAHPPASQESYIKWNLNDGQQSQLTRWSNNIKKMKVKQLFEWNIFGAFQVFWNRRKKKKKNPHKKFRFMAKWSIDIGGLGFEGQSQKFGSNKLGLWSGQHELEWRLHALI